MFYCIIEFLLKKIGIEELLKIFKDEKMKEIEVLEFIEDLDFLKKELFFVLLKKHKVEGYM